MGIHRYDRPVIFLREDWVSWATYHPNSDNHNRWWNDGHGLPGSIQDIASYLDPQQS